MTRPSALAVAPETWLFLAMGALGVALSAIGAFPASNAALVAVLAVAVALMGLPHGALDPWVARRAGLWKGRWGFAAFNLAYVAMAALVLVAWRLAPGISLALFLAISAWHFAGDWRDHLPGWARAMAGAALLALPAWRWPSQVHDSFVLLAGPEGALIATGLNAAAPWLAAGLVAVALAAMRRSRATASELMAVLALALALPPLVYFIVYFCALHSVRHLRLAGQDADPASRRRMVAVAVVYTALTLAAAAAAWPWLAANGAPARAPDDGLLRLVFIGLAALTLPHMAVVMIAERTRSGAP